MNNPCKNCLKRQLGCHIVCGRYKSFVKERQAINAKIRQENEYTFVGTLAFCLKRV